MTRRSAAVTGALLLFSAGLYVACGGDDATTAETSDGGTNDATVDTGGGNFDSGGDFDTGGGKDSGANDTGSNTDTGSGSDAEPDVQLIQDSGGTITDAGPGGDAATLNCGTAQCNLPTQTCCVYPLVYPPPPFYGACSTGNTCPTLKADSGIGDAGPATELQCEVQANCPANNVCCISAPTGGKISSHCVAAGSCATSITANDAGPDGGDAGFTVTPKAILCDPAATDAGCGDAGACTSTGVTTWNVPAGFGTCGGVTR